MRRILHLITNLGQGGAECQLAYLSRELVERGWDVHVGYLTPADGANLPRLREGGAHAFEIPNRGACDPRTPLRLLGLIRRLEPDLVQTWIPMMDVVGGTAARWAQVPWILTERNAPDFFPNDLKARLRRVVARGAQAVVSNSTSGDAYWSRQLSPELPRFVIHNALPLGQLAAVRDGPGDALGVPADRPLILFAGRLNAQKNLDVLLPALERAVRQSDAVAALCGRGDFSDRVAAFVRDRGLDDRLFPLGFQPRLWPWMRRASVFVSVSRHEGMPNTVMEAAALGCPLVLSDIPNHRDILDSDAAVFVPVGDPEAVASALLKILRDGAASRRLAERARRAAGRWSIEAAAQRHEEVYRKVCTS